MKDSYLIELIEYTDPYCTWCWGSEPTLRKIEEAYGDQIKISFKMGGLVKDMDSFSDPANGIGGSSWYAQVAAHWLEASTRHGMPVDEQIFFDVKDSRFSTHPANIAYKAAQFQGEFIANRYLRRMREGVAAERKDIQKLDIQTELASDVGLNTERFVADMKSGKANEAFEMDLKECRDKGIRGFPSYGIRNINDNEEFLVRGFRRFSEFQDLFLKASGAPLRPVSLSASMSSILAFVKKYEKVAEKEIAEVFDLSEERTDEYLTPLVSDGKLSKRKAGNGFFIVPINDC